MKKYHQENVLTESKVLDAEIVSGSVDSIPNYIYILLLFYYYYSCISVAAIFSCSWLRNNVIVLNGFIVLYSNCILSVQNIACICY